MLTNANIVSMEHRKLPLHVRMIQAELLRRQEKNPRYSLRAFSRFLEIHPSSVSRVLNGKMELTLEACASIIQKLTLSRDELRLFIASVAEDKRKRSAALLVRAIDPNLLENFDFDPRGESIIPYHVQKPLRPDNVLALGSDLLSMMDLEGRFIFADETAGQKLNTCPSQLIGELWSGTSLDKKTAELLQWQEQEVVAQQRERSFEFTMIDQNGEHHFLRTITPVLGADGKMHAFISAIKDVTWDKFLVSATQSIHSSVDLDVVLKLIPRATSQALATVSILELKEADGKSRIISAHLEGEARPGEFRDFVVASGFTSRSFTNSRTTIQFKSSPLPNKALLTPLKSGGVELGTLVLLQEMDFSDEKIRRASRLADSAAQAIVNARACS